MGLRIIHLVRHGQAEPGVEDAQLTALGRIQATLTATRLATMKRSPTTIVSSTLQRAKQTALIIGQLHPHIALRTSKDLCEGYPSRPPDTKLPPELREGREDFFQKEAARHARAFRRLTKPSEGDRVDIVVAHGNVIAAFVVRALGVPLEAWLQMQTVNCGISSMVVPPDGPIVLARFNDAGHLTGDLVTAI